MCIVYCGYVVKAPFVRPDNQVNTNGQLVSLPGINKIKKKHPRRHKHHSVEFEVLNIFFKATISSGLSEMKAAWSFDMAKDGAT